MMNRNDLGDCFARCYEFIIQKDLDSGFRLIHGLIIGQGEIEGVEHGHAWIEVDGNVFDLEYGVHMKVRDYERLARLVIKRTYSVEDALNYGAYHEHYGPWDREIFNEDMKGRVVKK